MHLTIMLPAGKLPLAIMQTAHDLATQYKLELFLTTAQNLRLLNVPEEKAEEIKKPLLEQGAVFKAPGKFPLPRTCVGAPHCPTAGQSTDELSAKIIARFGDRPTKPKFKIAIAGCPTGCSNPRLTDFGIIAGRKGYDLYLGGKGGKSPEVAVQVLRQVDESELLDAIEKVVAFHDQKTEKKQRIAALINDPDFPFSAL